MQSHSRLASVDLSRLIGAIAIVWIHGSIVPGSQDIARFAIPLFTIISTYFSAKAAITGSLTIRSYLITRSSKIAKIFFLWTLFYIIYNYIMWIFALCGKPTYSLSLLWRGGCYHLWFFPFILVAGLLSFVGVRFLLQIKHVYFLKIIKWIFIFLSFATVLWMDLVSKFHADLSKWGGIQMWIDAFPAALLGVALALIGDIRIGKILNVEVVSAFFSIIAVGCLALTSGVVHTFALMAGVSIFLYFLSTQFSVIPFQALSISDLAICIYLIHPAIYDLLKIFIIADSHSILLSLQLVFLNLLLCTILYLLFFRGSLKWCLK